MKNESRNTTEAHSEVLPGEDRPYHSSVQSCFMLFGRGCLHQKVSYVTGKHKLTEFGREHTGPQISPFFFKILTLAFRRKKTIFKFKKKKLSGLVQEAALQLWLTGIRVVFYILKTCPLVGKMNSWLWVFDCVV